MKERNEEIKEGSNDGGGIVNQEERERKREKTTKRRRARKRKCQEAREARAPFRRNGALITNARLPQQKGPKFGRIFMKYGARKSSIKCMGQI